MKLTKPIVIALVGLLAAPAFAWDAVGHMVIAAIALEHLSPKARAEAQHILAAGAPQPTDFILVSTWADEIRRDRRETGPWHYEDHHFRTDGQPVTTHPAPENAVWAIDRFDKILADKSRPLSERAEALRFLIHFVGDIHQPLHATARDSAEHPTGDKGGNDYQIQSPAELTGLRYPVRNLHSLWDLGGGLFTPIPDLDAPSGQRKIEEEAGRIEKEHPRRSIPKAGDRNAEDWALESFDIAKSFVYSTPEGQAPTPVYLEKARQISAERAATAGYRLADLVNRALG